MLQNNPFNKKHPTPLRSWLPRSLILSLVPLAPCSAYMIDNVSPLSIDESPTRQSSRLFPLPRFTTGSPVVSSPHGAEKRRGPFFSLPSHERKTAEGWAWNRTPIPRWKDLHTPRFLVHGDPSINTLRYVGIRLEASWEFLECLFPRPDQSPATPLLVEVFKSSRNYLAALPAKGHSRAFSFYDPAFPKIVLCTEINGLPRRDLDDALHHEIAHAYLHRIFNRLRPLWFTEGLAMFMELDYPDLSSDKTFLRFPITSAELEWFSEYAFEPTPYERFYGPEKGACRMKAWKTVQSWIRRRRASFGDSSPPPNLRRIPDMTCPAPFPLKR